MRQIVDNADTIGMREITDLFLDSLCPKRDLYRVLFQHDPRSRFSNKLKNVIKPAFKCQAERVYEMEPFEYDVFAEYLCAAKLTLLRTWALSTADLDLAHLTRITDSTLEGGMWDRVEEAARCAKAGRPFLKTSIDDLASRRPWIAYRTSHEQYIKGKEGPMKETRIIEVKQDILAANDEKAEAFRTKLVEDETFFVDVMAGPGAGKTTLLLALAPYLNENGTVGVIEADLESTVDSEKIKAAGMDAVQLETKGICHVEMGMVEKAYAAFGEHRYDFMFLENIGNLVCPADFDTGAHKRIMLLSVPEGYDKVYKYPPMFAVVDALVVTKTDYLPLNPDFDMDALCERARALNPDLKIFQTSARTGEGIEELARWLVGKRAELLR